MRLRNSGVSEWVLYVGREMLFYHGTPSIAQPGGEGESNRLFTVAGGATVGRDSLQQARVHQIYPKQQGQREVRHQTLF